MIKKQRWELAQAKEKNTWKEPAYELDSDDKLFKKYLQIIEKYIKFSKNTRVLEVGTGAYGIISCINKGELYGLDPLMDFFLINNKMKKGVKWIKGKGEELKFKDSFFDLVIISNVLDHAENPEAVLSEVLRTLKNKGHVFLTLNVYSKPRSFIKNSLEAIGCGDPCHPYTFSRESVKNLLLKKGFKIIHEQKALFDVDLVKTSKETSSFKKFKKYSSEDGFFFALKLSLGHIVEYIARKIFPEQYTIAFLAEKI
ncbi:MAG: class I SAM-dependent methyltransferase [Candidatus Nanoarchaeia archaeon]